MTSALAHMILAYITLLGSQSLLNAAPRSQTVQTQKKIVREGYIYTPDIGYHKLHTEIQQWNGARQVCKDEGGDLAIVNSEAEAEVLAKYLKETNTWEASVGLNDLHTEGEWVAIDGLPIAKTGFSDWDKSEPSNGGGRGEDCVVLRNNKKLNDVPCYQYNKFICEMPAP